MTGPPRREPRWPLFALLIGALLLRLRAWSNTGIMMNDGVDFLWQAQRWLEGDGAAAASHPYHPLYGACIAAASFVTGDLVGAGVTVSILGGLLLVASAWGLGRLAFPDTSWGGWTTALIATVHTRTLAFSGDIQAEGLFMGLFGAGAWALWAALVARRPVRALFGAGLVVGLAALTRQEGLLLALPVGLLWVLGKWRGVRPAPSFGGGAAFALGLALMLSPYVAFIHHATGDWGVSMKPSMRNMGLGGGGYDVMLAIEPSPLASPRTPDVELGPRKLPPRTRYWRPRPEDLRRSSVLPFVGSGDTLDDYGEDVAPVVGKWTSSFRAEGIILLIAGIGLAWRRRRGLVGMWAALTVAYLTVCTVHVSIAGFISDRHMLPALIVALPLLGAGFARIGASRPWDRGHPISRALCPALLGLMLLALIESGSAGSREDEDAHLAALTWVEQNLPEDQGIGVFKRRDGWYANRHVLLIELPYPDERLRAYMDAYDIGSLVVDHGHVEEDAPHWLEGAGFRVVARFAAASGDPDSEALVLVPAGG